MFLHEGLGSLGLWRDFPDRLCASIGYAGLVYSRYGNGYSSVLEERRDVTYMHDEARIALPRLLDELDIASPVLYGQSDGASIALIFAAQYPGRARALVLEAPHAFVEALSIQSIAAIGETFRSGALRERMRKHHADVERTFFGWNDIWLDPKFASWRITELLPSIVAPALCIQGKDDEYGTLAQIDTIARSNGGRVDRVVLDACRHAPHRERPQFVAGMSARWLVENAR